MVFQAKLYGVAPPVASALTLPSGVAQAAVPLVVVALGPSALSTATLNVAEQVLASVAVTV